MTGLDPVILFLRLQQDARIKSGHEDRRRVIFLMTGLDPVILFASNSGMASGFCYIMTNRPRGVLYVGVTKDLARRSYEHRMGTVEGFTSRYALTRLVFYEEYPMVMDAVQREKNIKHWSRQWKIELIEMSNPEWNDLYDQLA